MNLNLLKYWKKNTEINQDENLFKNSKEIKLKQKIENLNMLCLNIQKYFQTTTANFVYIDFTESYNHSEDKIIPNFLQLVLMILIQHKKMDYQKHVLITTISNWNLFLIMKLWKIIKIYQKN